MWEEETRNCLRMKYKVRAIAKAIAWHFPYQKTNRYYEIFDRHGNKLHFSQNWRQPDRMVVSGQSAFSQYHTRGIGIGMSRNTNLIIKDMKRRLLPSLKEQYKKDKQAAETSKAKHLKLMNVAKALCHMQGEKLKSKMLIEYSKRYGGFVVRIPGGSCELSYGYHSGEEKNIRCSFSVETAPLQAQKIINLLKAA